MVSHFLQCLGSHGDVFTVTCVLLHEGLDSAGSFWRSVTDEHPLFQRKSVLQGLFGWDLLYKHFDLLCELSHLSCWQVLVWQHSHQVFTSCSAWLSRLLPYFPRCWTFSVTTTIWCCPFHLLCVTATFVVGIVAKFARRQLLQLSRCSISHCGLLPREYDLLNALLFDLRCGPGRWGAKHDQERTGTRTSFFFF